VKPAAAETAERKTYLNRLEEMGLDEPRNQAGRCPAIELARVAAADAPFVEEMRVCGERIVPF